MTASAAERAASLSLWSGPVEPEPVSGGRTNQNFRVDAGGEQFFVRIGDDIPVHGVMRFNEVAASRAAHAAGVSPEVVHAEPGALVLRFVDGRTFSEADVRDAASRERVVDLISRVHDAMPMHFRGPALVFWVFQVVRDYANSLRDGASRMLAEVPRYLAVNAELEAALGDTRIAFGHNDLLADNFIDDGDRLWLVDWDYAGFNTPWFDLANLASNNSFDQTDEDWLIETYFDASVDDRARRRLKAMKAASLLRESMWSMVSEVHLDIDIDYVAYTTENLARFERAYAEFKAT